MSMSSFKAAELVPSSTGSLKVSPWTTTILAPDFLARPTASFMSAGGTWVSSTPGRALNLFLPFFAVKFVYFFAYFFNAG